MARDSHIELLLKKAAIKYVEAEGDLLIRELTELPVLEDSQVADSGDIVDGNANGIKNTAPDDTDLLQYKRIIKRARTDNAKRVVAVASTIAACIIVALVSLQQFNILNTWQSALMTTSTNDTARAPEGNLAQITSDVAPSVSDAAPSASGAETQAAVSVATSAASVATSAAAVTTAPAAVTQAAATTQAASSTQAATSAVSTATAPAATARAAEGSQAPQQSDAVQISPQQSDSVQDAQARPQVEIMYLSEMLPHGYILTFTDYDNEKTIYHIKNNRDNEIIIVAEPPGEFPATEGFIRVSVNDEDAYVMARKDYNVLFAQTDEMRLTFTSAYEVMDLIEMALVII